MCEEYLVLLAILYSCIFFWKYLYVIGKFLYLETFVFVRLVPLESHLLTCLLNAARLKDLKDIFRKIQ